MSESLTTFIKSLVPKDESCNNVVAIALGSNLGDRFANIEHALRLLEDPQVLSGANVESPRAYIIDTSFMYETVPMYVTDQPSFINCACMIETNIGPVDLLAILKRIETTVGRVPSIRNGPRAVDLDILLLNNEPLDTRDPNDRGDLNNLHGQLVVPHPRMHEREFVLRPLADMIPDVVPPLLQKPIYELLSSLTPTPDEPPMEKVISFPQYPTTQSVPSTSTYWAHRKPTRIMATLNTTPDSFSDGSDNNTIPTALVYVQKSMLEGADLVDVGGYSTRPNAAFVSEDEELTRVVPIISAIREAHPSLLISVDTFRPAVAKAAVFAGASCINDVYAFTGQYSYPLTESSARHALEMRNVARELDVPVVLMHSRGEASANKGYSSYRDMIHGIQVELGDKVDAMVCGRGGLRRWSVIVDPGIGFSKTVEDNLTALRRGAETVSFGQDNLLSGYPQLVGTSRKSFLGSILEKGVGGRKTEAKERGWATAAAVSCAIQQGAVIVRVHDVAATADIVQVGDAIWKA